MLMSAVVLLILCPVLLIIMLILRLTGEHKVFYFQSRVGVDQKPFQLIKFATMLENSASMPGGNITVKDDPRVLPFGKFLRKSKLNELPQLLNVFVGDMSLIGPRPLTQDMFEMYDFQQKEVISRCKPGLSGVGSIVFRAEENYTQNRPDPKKFYRNIIAPYKGSLEVWYYHNSSVKLYFILIALTIWHVLNPKSQAIWRTLRSLPKLPKTLRSF